MLRLTARRLAYLAATAWFNGLFYRRTLGGRVARGLGFAPRSRWPADPDRGAALLGGAFDLAGHREECPADPWRAAGTPERWRAALHGFAWLEDLRAAGGAEARDRARALVTLWLEREDRWRPLSWRPDVLGLRLASWLIAADYLFPPDALVDARPFLRSLARQANHLRRAVRLIDRPHDRLTALRGLIYGAVCLPEQVTLLPRWLERLAVELARQIGEDGGHLSRSPAVQLAVLQQLIDIGMLLEDAGRDVPPPIVDTILRMAPLLRGLLHGDGGLAQFNGSGEGDARLIAAVLRRSGAVGRQAVDGAGFARLAAGRTLVLVDVGPPPPPGFDDAAHAGALSFEMSEGGRRLIVNCGAAESGGAEWRLAQRRTGAHSTASFGGVDSALFRRDGTLGGRPRALPAERQGRSGRHLEAGLADYGGRPGLEHRRQLRLSASGDALGGTDMLIGAAGPAFDIRFHLHPSVEARLAADAASAILRLEDGGAWRLAAGGAELGLEESVYLGGHGGVRRSAQIVLGGKAVGGESRIDWTLTRSAAGGQIC